MRELGLKRLEKSLQSPRPHGTRTRYQQGCRCLPCRVACAQYQKDRVAHIKQGRLLNRIVPAEPARLHIEDLSKAGVGLDSVAEASSVHPWKLAEIRYGRLKNIREHNERRILAVTPDMLADGAHVPAGPVYRLINRLKKQGFTYDQLSERMGIARTTLVHRKPCVTAKTRLKVQLFYQRTMVA